jgi:hypothetical protein
LNDRGPTTSFCQELLTDPNSIPLNTDCPRPWTPGYRDVVTVHRVIGVGRTVSPNQCRSAGASGAQHNRPKPATSGGREKRSESRVRSTRRVGSAVLCGGSCASFCSAQFLTANSPLWQRTCPGERKDASCRSHRPGGVQPFDRSGSADRALLLSLPSDRIQELHRQVCTDAGSTHSRPDPEW